MKEQVSSPLSAVNFAALNVEGLTATERWQILYLAERVASYGATVRELLSSPTKSKRFVAAQLRNYDREVFLVVYLNSQHEVLASEATFQGTLDSCSVYPREIVKRALELNAGAVILGHPHPSGCPEPSAADRQITERIRQSLDLVDVRVLDHLVVGSHTSNVVSFAERGWL